MQWDPWSFGYLVIIGEKSCFCSDYLKNQVRKYPFLCFKMNNNQRFGQTISNYVQSNYSKSNWSSSLKYYFCHPLGELCTAQMVQKEDDVVLQFKVDDGIEHKRKSADSKSSVLHPLFNLNISLWLACLELKRSCYSALLWG